jgi:hypothetical protein
MNLLYHTSFICQQFFSEKFNSEFGRVFGASLDSSDFALAKSLFAYTFSQKPGFPGLRFRSGPAGALRAPSNPSRVLGSGFHIPD